MDSGLHLSRLEGNRMTINKTMSRKSQVVIAMVVLSCLLLSSCSPPETTQINESEQASESAQVNSTASEANDTINYVEFPLTDVDATKAFYSSVFGWQFQDWGPDYLSFSGARVDGGFSRELKPAAAGTGPLIVLFADNLDAKLKSVKSSGKSISREIFDFPGGRRFHFVDPNGNEVAVWSKTDGE